MTFLEFIKVIYHSMFHTTWIWLIALLLVAGYLFYVFSATNKGEKSEKTDFLRSPLFLYLISTVSIFIFIFLLIRLTGNFNVKTNFTFVALGITVSIFSPILTFIVFLRTIKIQEDSNKNQAKERISKDFYELTKIFIGKRDAIHENIYGSEEPEDDFSNIYGTRSYFPSNKYAFAKEYFERNYIIYGDYFKIFHRILKILNLAQKENILSQKEYENYIGILRSQLSETELALIYYNSVYAVRGYGMAVELFNSNIFGNDDELRKSVHLRLEYLMDEVADAVIIGAFYSSPYVDIIPDNDKKEIIKASHSFDVTFYNKIAEMGLLDTLKKMYEETS